MYKPLSLLAATALAGAVLGQVPPIPVPQPQPAPSPPPLLPLIPPPVDHPAYLGQPAMNPAQQALSDQMLDYWSRFVADGAPRAVGQPNWPVLGANVAVQPWMSLQPDGSRTVSTFGESHQCPFWASLAE